MGEEGHRGNGEAGMRAAARRPSHASTTGQSRAVGEYKHNGSAVGIIGSRRCLYFLWDLLKREKTILGF